MVFSIFSTPFTKFASSLLILCFASEMSDSAFDIFSRIVTIKFTNSRNSFNDFATDSKLICFSFLLFLDKCNASSLAT